MYVTVHQHSNVSKFNLDQGPARQTMYGLCYSLLSHYVHLRDMYETLQGLAVVL